VRFRGRCAREQAAKVDDGAVHGDDRHFVETNRDASHNPDELRRR
jgi:hypothetical protein